MAGTTPTPPGSDFGRFAPGEILLERYRIVSLLGRGGMGEVYRAEDLTLGQQVALKFLSTDLVGRPGLRERFLAEVRLAREVSHPSVCRVFDMGEVDDQIFLSMEYVDGEDLGSLLRRVGRLPPEKAFEILRQLCAGLAAVHDRGMVHRDLKPANVMLDGRGAVRLTDFGLAAALAGDTAEEVAGTPEYMAPELTGGGQASVASDVYALGLILHEILTGHRCFTGETFADILRAHREETPAPASSLVPEIDPEIDAVIERCLDKDPQGRPPSALAVAAALPGGDPLAEALARGETPSLETVAASGGTGALRPAVASAWLAVTVLAALALCWVCPSARISGLMPLELPPDVLEHRARELLDGALRYTGRYEDWDWKEVYTVRGLDLSQVYGSWLRAVEGSDGALALPRGDLPPPYYFWYRASRRPIYSRDPHRFVTRANPQVGGSFEAVLMLRPDGRLHYYEAYWGNWTEHADGPEFADDVWAPPAPPDPSTVNGAELLRLAGFDPEAMRPVRASLWPSVPVDFRLAWLGPAPGTHGPAEASDDVRVEAGFKDGKVASWSTFNPTPPTVSEQAGGSRLQERLKDVRRWLMPTMIIGMFLMAPWLILRSFRQGSGDRRGASKLAWIVVITSTLGWLLGTDFSMDFGVEFWRFSKVLGRGLFFGGACWMLYLGLEPHVRRVWPNMLVGWSRALCGGWRDPMVARDVLAGLGLGLILCLVEPLAAILSGAGPTYANVKVMLGLASSLSEALVIVSSAIRIMLVAVVMMALLRTLLRNRAVTVLAMGVIGLLAMPQQGSFPSLWVELAVSTLKIGTWLFVALRFGVLALVFMQVVYMVSFEWPLTLDLSAWHATPSIVFLLGVGVTALLAFRMSVHWGAERVVPRGPRGPEG